MPCPACRDSSLVQYGTLGGSINPVASYCSDAAGAAAAGVRHNHQLQQSQRGSAGYSGGAAGDHEFEEEEEDLDLIDDGCSSLRM